MLGAPRSLRTLSAMLLAHLTATVSSTPRGGFAHEQHVRIGSIAEFATAESAHADDGETGRRLGPEFGDAGLITAESDALSTAAHTEDSALQTAGTSSMPRMSADAIRASSCRRNERAAATARLGSLCRPEAVRIPRATSSGFGSTRRGPLGESANKRITSGALMSRS